MTFLEELEQQKDELKNKECNAIEQIMEDQIKEFEDYVKEYDTQNLLHDLSYLALTQKILEDLELECTYYRDDLDTIDIVYTYHVKNQEYIFYTIIDFLQKNNYSIEDIADNKQYILSEIINLLYRSIKS